MRTYKDAVILMVEWWIRRIRNSISIKNKTMYTFNNTKLKIKENNIWKFRNKLYELLRIDSELPSFSLLEVDYMSNQFLREACKYSEIPYFILPYKCHTHISDENVVKVYEKSVGYSDI